MTTPAKTGARIAIGRPEPASLTASTLVKDITEPTERSMPPEMMTMVMPTDKRPSTAFCLTMLSRFSEVRNSGLRQPPTTTTATSGAKAPSRRRVALERRPARSPRSNLGVIFDGTAADRRR
jgi:hypothetical protein